MDQDAEQEKPPSSEADTHVNRTTSIKSTGRATRWKNVWKRWKQGDESDWWFASTGIPLLAATLGPLANVSSIAALVTSWRQTNYVDGVWLTDFDGVSFADPRWCYWINVASLICGFLGNVFLLLNFTQRIRYIIALPATIIFWYLASGFLIAITISMHVYEPPAFPEEVYTQGFWYAIAAATFYTICSMILMVNMLGYFLGHYSQNFALSDSQRTLILQTMSFFIWLGGGAAVFSKIESDSGNDGWSFPDALYFCDVTILTVGFGDLAPTIDLSRGLVFPYSVGGICFLALIVSSLYKAVRELSQENIVLKHQRRMRERTIAHTVTNSFDLRHRERDAHRLLRKRSLGFPRISSPVQPRPFRTPMDETSQRPSAAPRVTERLRANRRPKVVLLREEKDRFEAMRQIQADSKKFKRWMALFWSVTTFIILWCVGAVVFWRTERHTLGMTYFQALYFCYISLLTVGYGDLSPTSNPGRVFFVVWSLIAVPTMTILVSDLGDTVVAKLKKWSDQLADFTVLPKKGLWRAFLMKHPWLYNRVKHRVESHAVKSRMKRGFDTVDPREATPVTDIDMARDIEDQAFEEDEAVNHPTMANLAAEAERDIRQVATQASLSRQLALSIQKVSGDIRWPKKRYNYEEWVEFTRLIRLTAPDRLDKAIGEGLDEDNGDEGLVNWDWIGDNSPMASGIPESEWLLERLCESLVRLERRREVARDRADLQALRKMESHLPDDAHREEGHFVPAQVNRQRPYTTIPVQDLNKCALILVVALLVTPVMSLPAASVIEPVAVSGRDRKAVADMNLDNVSVTPLSDSIKAMPSLNDYQAGDQTLRGAILYNTQKCKGLSVPIGAEGGYNILGGYYTRSLTVEALIKCRFFLDPNCPANGCHLDIGPYIVIVGMEWLEPDFDGGRIHSIYCHPWYIP